ncbi:hypothetical protein EYC80_007007 [Monilinia laxa]|uniref:Uncharacterized protein n=1 Tax=Monilinia laxa TaxID=61186 RepID=A0A5N6JZW8_MONLA|nr:hypothetical protein EYC80_007007 [Monilinia laxa]
MDSKCSYSETCLAISQPTCHCGLILIITIQAATALTPSYNPTLAFVARHFEYRSEDFNLNSSILRYSSFLHFPFSATNATP